MIDWRLVMFSALWIAGASLLLATSSWAGCAAAQAGGRVWVKLKEPGYQAALRAGLTLFCAGVAGSVRVGWEMLLWLLLSGTFACQTWQALRRRSN